MKELTLKFDEWGLNKELEEYLYSQKGVLEIEIYPDKEEIYIKYNPNLTSIKIIKLEILLFLSSEIPSIIAFDKHFKKKTINANIIIKDMCCEYCYKSMIEELLLVEGIESAFSDYANNYNYNNNKNVVINITYDSKMITKEEIAVIELKLNSYESLNKS